ncbi:MAG: flagellar protein FlgN [Thermacetogeniaceae bacterium]
MSGNRANLLAVLKEQSDAVNLLIELGLAEIDAFKKDDIPSLISITERQRDAVDRTQRLEQWKVVLLREIGSQQVVDNISQCQVLESITDFSQEIEAETRHLGELVKRLKEINETNRLLASMSMGFVKTIQRALGMATGSYDARGMLSGPPVCVGRLDASV